MDLSGFCNRIRRLPLYAFDQRMRQALFGTNDLLRAYAQKMRGYHAEKSTENKR